MIIRLEVFVKNIQCHLQTSGFGLEEADLMEDLHDRLRDFTPGNSHRRSSMHLQQFRSRLGNAGLCSSSTLIMNLGMFEDYLQCTFICTDPKLGTRVKIEDSPCFQFRKCSYIFGTPSGLTPGLGSRSICSIGLFVRLAVAETVDTSLSNIPLPKSRMHAYVTGSIDESSLEDWFQILSAVVGRRLNRGD